jgi:flagellar biosynthesis/type III secretory pathway chaperone
MKELAERLIGLIRDEEQVLEDFLDCLTRQKEFIIQNQVEKFDLTVQEQESLITRIRELEAGRIEVVRTIALQAGSEDDLTITRLIELNLGETSDELKSLKRTLAGLIERIKKANRVNQYLIKRSLSFIQKNIDMFIDEGDAMAIYLPNGSRRPRGASRLIVDKAF